MTPHRPTAPSLLALLLPLALAGAAEAQTSYGELAPPGECAKPRGLAPVDPPIVPMAHLDALPPVAARPDLPELPTARDMPRRSPCDDPGAGCGALDLPGPSVIEQPEGTDPFPGGGDFPGGGGEFPGDG